MSMPKPARLDGALPWFPWFPYVHRADRRTHRLTLAAEGLFRRLIDEEWLEGPLPDDPAELARIGVCTAQEFRENWPLIEAYFVHTDGAKIISRKLEGVRTERDAKRLQAAKAGRKGGLAKANAQLEFVADAKQPLSGRIARVVELRGEERKAEGIVADAKQTPAPTESLRVQSPELPAPLLPAAELNGNHPPRPADPAPAADQFEEVTAEPVPLPLVAEIFLNTFYRRATPERLADVRRQLEATLTPEGVTFEHGSVRAASAKHLGDCCKLITSRVLQDPNIAITIVLKKVRETYLEELSASHKQLAGTP